MSDPGGLTRFVLGKGGTGKSTVAAALGMASARSGTPALVVELAARAVIPEMLGAAPARDEPREIMPGLFSFSIDPETEAERHLRESLAIGPLIARLTRSGALGEFARAAPGVAELVSLDRIRQLVDDGRFGQTIVDLPSTGHALALLGAPAEAVAVARDGPLGERAGPLDAALRDADRTALSIVTNPTELAIAEGAEAWRAVAEMGLPAPDLILNRMTADAFAEGEEPALRAVAAVGGPVGAAAAGALALLRRRGHDERLRDALLAATGATEVRELPAVAGEIDEDALWTLAAASVAGAA